MPRRDVRMYLHDIVAACDHIASHVRNVDEAEFLCNRLVQAAVERELSVIGEAMVQLRKHEPGVAEQIAHSESIARFRNMLVHAYDLIDHSRMWSIVSMHVSALRADAARLLAEQGEG